MKLKTIETSRPKTIKASKDLTFLETLSDMLFEFRKDFGTKPVSILLHPNDYYRLSIELAEKETTHRPLSIHNSFMGIPIRLRTAAGIDFEIPDRLRGLFVRSEDFEQ